MKVALISPHSFVSPGGVKTHVLELANEFQKRGIETKIIIPRRKLKENYGKDVILLGTSFPIEFGGSISDLGISFNPISIELLLRKENFDVLHFHNFTFPGTLQILLSSVTKKTLNILTFHSNIKGSQFLKNFPFLVSLLNKFLQWKIDGIIGVASFVLKFFKEYQGPKIVIPNGINLQKFNPRVKKIEKFQDGKINLLFVGRIDERKGLIYLLKAFKILKKKYKNLRLIVVGSGTEEEKCKNFVKENKLLDVVFEGQKSHDELPYFYASCDIFISPAIFGESFGIVLLEAMACGKPFVAFANEGYKELLKNKRGEEFLVPPRNVKKLAEKIEILIKNPKLREEMGKWGEKEAKNYDWSKIAEKVLNFYQICKKEKEIKKFF
jgi:phosphatidylinositol alpha-mannosyltransferase